jgi:hypothetical protein
MKARQSEAASAGLAVVFTSQDATPEVAAAYVRDEAMPWPYLPPGAGGEVRALGGRSTPDLVVVDRQGRILCRAYTPQGRYLGAAQVFEAALAALKTASPAR